MGSIKTKLITLIGGLIAIICGGLGLISYICSMNALNSNLEKTLPQLAVQTSHYFDSTIEGNLKALEEIAGREDINDPNISLADKALILKEAVERNGSLRMIYNEVDGECVDQNGQILSRITDEGYTRALNGESNVTDPIISQSTGKLVVAYTVPVMHDNKIVGLLRETKDGNEFSEMIDKVKFGQTGKAYILSGSGITIAHPNRDKVLERDCVIDQVKDNPSLKELAAVNQRMINGETDMDKYSYNGKEYYAGFSPIDGTSWSLAVQMEKTEILSETTGLKISILLASIAFLSVGLICIYRFAVIITNKMKANSAHLMLMAEGDLSMEVPQHHLKLKDETGQVANSMRKMQESLKEMISVIKNDAYNINVQSENLSAIAEEISSSSQNVTEAINNVAIGSGEQSENIKVIADTLENFSGKLSHMVENVHTVDLNSREIGAKASKSNDEMNELNRSISSMGDSFRSFSSKITEFGQDVKKIDEITRLIDEVAEQTNLLALNASIEAARAGEAGKGFAVVADEISHLAEQSKTSAESISKLIGAISQNTDNIVNDSIEIDNKLKTQADTINNSIKSFKEIVDEVDIMIPKIDTLRVSAEDIEHDKNDILEKIDSLAEISVDVSSSAEEISASSQEMNSATGEVASSAQVLNDMTNEMMNEVNKFKI